MRSFFEEVLGWEHGREFICVASMNTMAALIGGMTIHSWGEVSINDEQRMAQAAKKRQKQDANIMYTKCESLQFILIDEGSSASCENLGIMEANVRNATREAPETYKIRPAQRGGISE